MQKLIFFEICITLKILFSYCRNIIFIWNTGIQLLFRLNTVKKQISRSYFSPSFSEFKCLYFFHLYHLIRGSGLASAKHLSVMLEPSFKTIVPAGVELWSSIVGGISTCKLIILIKLPFVLQMYSPSSSVATLSIIKCHSLT